ncbi:uncharacterized protein isoform X1 [Rhodnius prolixus]|uniref:uncharacterized protein isoform X1 n=1 Tax=Rhodnius prolixus TaxID=13249 RepID=UPI003D18C0F4
MWSYMHCPAPALCPRCSNLAVTFVNPYTYQTENDPLIRKRDHIESPMCQQTMTSSQEINEQRRRNSDASSCSSNSSTSSTCSSSSDDTSSISTESSVCIEYNLSTPPSLLPLQRSKTL